ncbi:MAG: hypothetical protein ACOYJB_01875 [Christensenellaceae bacterium]|jgi:hypothetical protein
MKRAEAVKLVITFAVASAIVVAAVFLLSYAFTTRRATVQNKVQAVETEQELPISLPVEERQPLPEYTLVLGDLYVDLQNEDMDMEEAGEICVREMIELSGQDFGGGTGFAHFSAKDNRRQWTIFFQPKQDQFSFREYMMSVDTVNGNIYTYTIYNDGMEYDDAYYEWLETPFAYEDYVAFEKECVKKAEEVLLRNASVGQETIGIENNSWQVVEQNWIVEAIAELYISLSDGSAYRFVFFNRPEGVMLQEYSYHPAAMVDGAGSVPAAAEEIEVEKAGW